MTGSELPSAPLHAVVRPQEELTETVQVARVLWLRSLFGETAVADERERPMDVLASRMTEYFVPRGTPLYQQGSSSNSLYFIVEGRIDQGDSGYTRYVSGDVLGFVDAMIGRPHARTAMVFEDAVVLRLKIDDWLDYLDEHFSALRRLVLASIKNIDNHPDRLGDDSEEIYSSLSSDLSENATSSFVKLLLAARLNPLFRLASIQAIAQLARRGQSTVLGKGDTWEGLTLTPGLCLVVGGTVNLLDPVSHKPSARPTSYSPGQLVGSIRALLPFPDPFVVQAESAAQLLHIDTETFFDIMEDHFDLGRSTLSYVASRVEDLNARKTSTEEPAEVA
jgi:CRP-like cAMP-binding protein